MHQKPLALGLECVASAPGPLVHHVPRDEHGTLEQSEFLPECLRRDAGDSPEEFVVSYWPRRVEDRVARISKDALKLLGG